MYGKSEWEIVQEFSRKTGIGDIAFIDFMKREKELEATTSIGHYDAGFE